MNRILTIALLMAIQAASVTRAEQESTISVQGSAEVRVVPDEILIRVAAESRATKLGEAKQDNDRKIRDAIAFLKKSGVPDVAISTEVVHIQPEFDYQKSRITPEAYIVKRQLNVKLSKLDTFEPIFSGLIEYGINIVEGVEFRTTQLRQHRDEARKLAIRAAKEKATAMANELGVQVTGVRTIHENTWGGAWTYGRGANAMSQNAMVARGGAPVEEGGLHGGQLQVSAQVDVVFTLAPMEGAGDQSRAAKPKIE